MYSYLDSMQTDLELERLFFPSRKNIKDFSYQELVFAWAFAWLCNEDQLLKFPGRVSFWGPGKLPGSVDVEIRHVLHANLYETWGLKRLRDLELPVDSEEQEKFLIDQIFIRSEEALSTNFMTENNVFEMFYHLTDRISEITEVSQEEVLAKLEYTANYIVSAKKKEKLLNYQPVTLATLSTKLILEPIEIKYFIYERLITKTPIEISSFIKLCLMALGQGESEKIDNELAWNIQEDLKNIVKMVFPNGYNFGDISLYFTLSPVQKYDFDAVYHNSVLKNEYKVEIEKLQKILRLDKVDVY